MRTMLDDRVLLADMRLFRPRADISGKGGAVGIVVVKGSRLVPGSRRSLGQVHRPKRPREFMKGQGNVAPMSIRVQRHNPTAKQVDCGWRTALVIPSNRPALLAEFLKAWRRSRIGTRRSSCSTGRRHRG